MSTSSDVSTAADAAAPADEVAGAGGDCFSAVFEDFFPDFFFEEVRVRAGLRRGDCTRTFFFGLPFTDGGGLDSEL